MNTILITGGAGFIGSNFISYMYKKYPDLRFLVLDALTYAGNIDNFSLLLKNDKRFQFWYGDVRNPEIVNSLVAQSDYIVHFAAETHVARSIYDNRVFFETDVLGTQTICNAILKNDGKFKKFIHISTSEVYGSALNGVMDENHSLLPCSPYASAKAGADRLVYSYWNTYEIPAIIIRPFNNYGPHQHLEKVIPRFITSAILNEPVTIHGDGSASRDWVYVEDNCRAIDAALHTDNEELFGKVINIGTGKDIDIYTIAKTILDKMNKTESLIQYISNRPGQVDRHISSTKLAGELLGWEAETDFEKGLDTTIDWYASNQNWWQQLRWMKQVPIKLKDGSTVLH